MAQAHVMKGSAIKGNPNLHGYDFQGRNKKNFSEKVLLCLLILFHGMCKYFKYTEGIFADDEFVLHGTSTDSSDD